MANLAIEDNSTIEDNVSPAETLIQMVMGIGVVQIIGIAAELGIADLLKEGPLHSDEIARQCDTFPRPTYRVLRALSNYGVFEENEEKYFSLTPMSACLLKDTPGSFNALARMTSSSWLNKAFNNLLYTLKTGKNAFREAHGKSMFEWLSENPDDGVIFQHAMSTFSGMEVDLVLNAYDFSKAQCVVDVGGGVGLLITNIVKRYPELKGILFDMPEVMTNAQALIESEEISDRCEFISGDFFDSIPEGGDIYILKHVLHDWDDERSRHILGNVAGSMTAGAYLLVMEQGIAAPGVPCPGKLMDMSMMALTEGGMERTPEEHAALFESVNIEFVRSIETPGPITIFEGIKQ